MNYQFFDNKQWQTRIETENQKKNSEQLRHQNSRILTSSKTRAVFLLLKVSSSNMAVNKAFSIIGDPRGSQFVSQHLFKKNLLRSHEVYSDLCTYRNVFFFRYD